MRNVRPAPSRRLLVGLREEQSERAKVQVDACACTCAGMRGCVDVRACLCCAFVKVRGSEHNRWPNTLFLLAVIFVAAIVTDVFISNGALASKPRCPCYLQVLERQRGENTGIEIDTHLKPSASKAEEPEEVVAFELVEGQRCNSSLPAAFTSLNRISLNLGWQM